MTKNKDPMLQELGTVINNRTATQKAQVPFNEQAQFLIENALDLIKQVLVKHSAAVLEEMRDQIVKRNERISNLEGSVSTLESECNQLNDLSIKQREIIDNLASMCRRLSYSVKRSGNDKLAHECVVLLKKYDLGGSVLRNMEGPAELCPKPAPGLEIDERGVLVRKEDKDDMQKEYDIYKQWTKS